MNTDNTGEGTAGEPPDLLGLYCSSLYRKCSNCGRTGHNSRTCLETRTESTTGAAQSKEDEPLNGAKKEDEELSDELYQKDKPKDGGRRKGVAWTEEEHKSFLTGLQKLGKGNWRGISRHFVQSKSPTQVASHAQKYFIRQTVAGKRKRRSSLFDLVPENERVRETNGASQSTGVLPVSSSANSDIKGEPGPAADKRAPSQPPVQSPEAMWLWYQNMMMQQQSMAWLSPMMGPPISQKTANGSSIPQMPLPAIPGMPGALPNMASGIMLPPVAMEGPPDAAANPALAAFLAQQSQIAAVMAMNYMPQFSPEYLARCAAEMQIRATQAAEAAAAMTVANEAKEVPEASAGDNLSALTREPSPETVDNSVRPSKIARMTKTDSRLDFSNDSTETEEFGNGALVKPKASKATSFAELPPWVHDKKGTGSLLNSSSRMSQSTRLEEQTLRKRLGGGIPGSVNNLQVQAFQRTQSQDQRPQISASQAPEVSISETTPSTTNDASNLATSQYKAKA